MHNTIVVKQNNRFEVICNVCGLIAKNPTQRGMMEAKARQHMLDNGIAAATPAARKAGRPHKADAAKRVIGMQQIAVVNINNVKPVAKVGAKRTCKEWNDFVHANGLRKLGEGVSRKVYALSETTVIKIDKGVLNGFNDGFQAQCASEVNVWNNASEEQREYLAAIIDSGKGWIIAERALQTVSQMLGEGGREIGHTLTTETGIRDLHIHNIGYFGKGRFKIIDYAL